MKILIIGASSYVGARLYFDIAKQHDVTGTFSQHQLSPKFIHLDVTRPDEVSSVIEKAAPEIIIHVAQNPDPRWCEAHPDEARNLNITPTESIVHVAHEKGIKIIYISSYAAIFPNNMYARTKRESEAIVQKAQGGYLILRPSFILGFSPNTTNDRPFNRLLKNLDQGTPAEYDTSWKFQPTYVGHISEVILASVERSIWNQTIHITVPDLKSRFDTAKDILSPFGITVTPIDKHDTTNVIKNPLNELTALDLPTYTYQRMIDTIIGEIKHRSQFVI
jgi:dTDP-4-dehydrorhamnose reductase